MRLKRGFTLVELLVAISIIAVLSVIGLTTYAGVQAGARDARRKSDLNQINLYLEAYYNNNGKYPKAGSCDYGSNCYVYSTAGESWLPALISSGIANRLPLDPVNNAKKGPWEEGHYSYSYGNLTADGQTYDLTTQLENTNDSDRCGVKNWKYNSALAAVAAQPWCTTFKGQYSDQIYEASPDR